MVTNTEKALKVLNTCRALSEAIRVKDCREQGFDILAYQKHTVELLEEVGFIAFVMTEALNPTTGFLK